MARPIRLQPRPMHSRALGAPAPVPPPDPDLLNLKKSERSKDGKPFQGKTTALGRKTERPDEGKPAGPSGQKEGLRHNKRHANK